MDSCAIKKPPVRGGFFYSRAAELDLDFVFVADVFFRQCTEAGALGAKVIMKFVVHKVGKVRLLQADQVAMIARFDVNFFNAHKFLIPNYVETVGFP